MMKVIVSLLFMTSVANAQMVTVQTAAGIPITIASHLSGKFQGFISDLVSSGYKPKNIHCHARGGHVRHSRHYAGAACDIDQRGWGKTASTMYHVSHLTRKHGLRDGKSFGDAGHIDDGAVSSQSRVSHRRHRRQQR